MPQKAPAEGGFTFCPMGQKRPKGCCPTVSKDSKASVAVLARALPSSQSMRSGARIVFAPTGKEGLQGKRSGASSGASLSLRPGNEIRPTKGPKTRSVFFRHKGPKGALLAPGNEISHPSRGLAPLPGQRPSFDEVRDHFIYVRAKALLRCPPGKQSRARAWLWHSLREPIFDKLFYLKMIFLTPLTNLNNLVLQIHYF